jgi:hypothetical protein
MLAAIVLVQASARNMNISSFDDLLHAARRQAEPQRLLFVFAGAELPPDSTAAQRNRFATGRGGALVPLMCVDKAPGELGTFAELVEESRRPRADWAIVFVAALAGRGGLAPTSDEVEASLQRMVEAIKAGAIGSFIPFNRNGEPVLLD